MLKIWSGPFRDDCITDVNLYFKTHKKSDWFNHNWVRKVIKDIDRVDAIQDEYMISPVIGAMSPNDLSSGCKCLIMMYNLPDSNVYASRCGDNCAKYIVELSRQRDVTITLHHAMLFNIDFEGKIMNTGQEFNTYKGYVNAFLDWRYGPANDRSKWHPARY